MSTWVDTFVIERWGLLTWFLGFWYIGEDPIYRALVDAGIEGKGEGARGDTPTIRDPEDDARRRPSSDVHPSCQG